MCDIGCVDNNFDVVDGMCKEFKFKAPFTAKLMDMMQALDEEYYENSLLTQTAFGMQRSHMARQTLYRYESQKLGIAMKYAERLCKRAEWSRSMKINMLKDLYREIFGLQESPSRRRNGGDGGDDGDGGGAVPQPSHDSNVESPAEDLPDYVDSDEECAAQFQVADPDIDEGGDGTGAFSVSDDEGSLDVSPLRPWPMTPCTTASVNIRAQQAQMPKRQKKTVLKKPVKAKAAAVVPAVVPDYVFRAFKKRERGQDSVQIRNTITKKTVLQVTADQAGGIDNAVRIAEHLVAELRPKTVARNKSCSVSW